MRANDLAATWHALVDSAPTATHLRLFAIGPEVPGGTVLAGLDPEGRRHLLIPVPPGTPVRPDSAPGALTITVSEPIVHGTRTRCIDLRCNEHSLVDIFERLAADVLDLLEREPGSHLTAAHTVVDRWRSLLAVARAPIGREALLGLHAELQVLRRTLVHDPALRVDHWVGPTKSVHDMRRNGLSIEVKATSVREGLRVGIHGVDQLASDTGERLVLAVLRLEEHEDGESADEIVDDMVQMGASESEIVSIAQLTGWKRRDTEDRFRVVEWRWYEVDDGFPRIVPTSFAAGKPDPGVISVRYTVELTGGVPTSLSETHVEGLLMELAGS